MANTSSKILDEFLPARLQVFEKAREATLTLLALKDILTSSELETLEILLDKKSLNQISESLQEAKKGELEPIESILK